jgi:hypothetical protein
MCLDPSGWNIPTQFNTNSSDGSSLYLVRSNGVIRIKTAYNEVHVAYLKWICYLPPGQAEAMKPWHGIDRVRRNEDNTLTFWRSHAPTHGYTAYRDPQQGHTTCDFLWEDRGNGQGTVIKRHIGHEISLQWTTGGYGITQQQALLAAISVTGELSEEHADRPYTPVVPNQRMGEHVVGVRS